MWRADHAHPETRKVVFLVLQPMERSSVMSGAKDAPKRWLVLYVTAEGKSSWHARELGMISLALPEQTAAVTWDCCVPPTYPSITMEKVQNDVAPVTKSILLWMRGVLLNVVIQSSSM